MFLLLLATSPWGLSKLWGGGVPTPDIDHSGPRLSCLLFCILLIGTVPPSPPSVQCPDSPDIVFYPNSARYHLTTQASPVSAPEYGKPLPEFTPPITSRDLILLSYLAPTTPARFLLPLLPRCRRNLFQHGFHMFFCRHLLPPCAVHYVPETWSRYSKTKLEVTVKNKWWGLDVYRLRAFLVWSLFLIHSPSPHRMR